LLCFILLKNRKPGVETVRLPFLFPILWDRRTMAVPTSAAGFMLSAANRDPAIKAGVRHNCLGRLHSNHPNELESFGSLLA